MPTTVALAKGTLLQVYGDTSVGLTARGRTMRVTVDQIVVKKSPNIFYNIMLTHIAGPMKGMTIKFSRIRGKKSRIRVLCTCDAYSHIHAQGEGKCQE